MTPPEYPDTLTKLYSFQPRDVEEIKKCLDAALRQQLKFTRIDPLLLDNLASLRAEISAPFVIHREGKDKATAEAALRKAIAAGEDVGPVTDFSQALYLRSLGWRPGQ